MLEPLATMIGVLFALGVLGLVTSTVYTALGVRAAGRFARRRKSEQTGAFLPPVSLIKPVHGYEQDMEAHLATFFQQDYPKYEILFCARTESDAGLAAARRVAARFPKVATQFVTCGNSPYPNAKVWSLERMQPLAKHSILVVSDSDVSVGSDYIRSVVAPFADEKVGLVTCLYRGCVTTNPKAPVTKLWSDLEATGMSVEMSSGVIVADMLEGMQFALGPTMVARRTALEKIGGFAALGPYHADDFVLGNMIAASGYRVVLSTYVVEHNIPAVAFEASAEHQIRWMKSTRFSRPKGHFGTVLTYSMPYGVLAGLMALAMHRPLLALTMFAAGWLSRVVLALAVGGGVVKERNLFRVAALYPVRDLLGFFFWCASYLGSHVEWRGEAYTILPDGRMQPLQPPADDSKHGAVVTT